MLHVRVLAIAPGARGMGTHLAMCTVNILHCCASVRHAEDGSSSENGTTTVSVDDFVSVCSEPVETLGYVQGELLHRCSAPHHGCLVETWLCYDRSDIVLCSPDAHYQC